MAEAHLSDENFTNRDLMLISDDFAYVTDYKEQLLYGCGTPVRDGRKVSFYNLDSEYPTDYPIRISYSINSNLKNCIGDKMGLFNIGWTNMSEMISFVHVPIPSLEVKTLNLSLNDEPAIQHLIFPAEHLPKGDEDPSEKYQFCYITSSDEVVGKSSEFNFFKLQEIEDYIAVEDPGDPGLVVLKTREAQLKEDIEKLKNQKMELEGYCESYQAKINNLLEEMKQISKDYEIAQCKFNALEDKFELKKEYSALEDCRRARRDIQRPPSCGSDFSFENLQATIYGVEHTLNSFISEQRKAQRVVTQGILDLQGNSSQSNEQGERAEFVANQNGRELNGAQKNGACSACSNEIAKLHATLEKSFHEREFLSSQIAIIRAEKDRLEGMLKSKVEYIAFLNSRIGVLEIELRAATFEDMPSSASNYNNTGLTRSVSENPEPLPTPLRVILENDNLDNEGDQLIKNIIANNMAPIREIFGEKNEESKTESREQNEPSTSKSEIPAKISTEFDIIQKCLEKEREDKIQLQKALNDIQINLSEFESLRAKCKTLETENRFLKESLKNTKEYENSNVNLEIRRLQEQFDILLREKTQAEQQLMNLRKETVGKVSLKLVHLKNDEVQK